jgi:hypothetical protein
MADKQTIQSHIHCMSVYLSFRFYDSCRRLPVTKRHSSTFLHWSCFKYLSVMAACTPSIHVFLGRRLFRLCTGTHFKINFVILSSGILLTWQYHCGIFSLWCLWCSTSLSPPLFPLYCHSLFFEHFICFQMQTCLLDLPYIYVIRILPLPTSVCVVLRAAL